MYIKAKCGLLAEVTIPTHTYKKLLCAIFITGLYSMDNGYERATKEIIPAIRTLIARELKERYGMKETEIAQRLSVAQAAVSKYLHGRYSNRIKMTLDSIDRSYIDKYIGKIAEGKEAYTNMCICSVCNAMNKFGCKFSSVRPTR